MLLKQEVLLGKIALERGIVTKSQLAECIAFKTTTDPDRPLVSILIERSFLDDESLEVILADQREMLRQEQRKKRKKRKLRSSQGSGSQIEARSVEKTRSGKRRSCRECGQTIPDRAERCMHCGKMVARGPATRRIEKRRLHSNHFCSLCFYPALEEETHCLACHAVFLGSGDEGEFKCSACNRFVGEEDEICPWCAAEFS